MNILLINYMETTTAGGINKTVREIAKQLAERNHRVTVLQPNLSNFPSEEIYDGFKILRVRSRFGHYFYDLSSEIFFFIIRNIKKLNPDIIHVHGYHTLFSPEVLFLLKKINPSIPLVFSPHLGVLSHNTFAGKHLWNFYNQLIGKKIIELSDYICVASHYELSNLHLILKVSATKIIIIPHGVDVIDLNYQKCRTDTINLLYAGYLLELKGVHYILEALYILIFKVGIKVKLTIIGEGPYEFKLKQLTKELNLNQFVSWHGFLPSEELILEFKKSDIFLLTSMSENYGIVVAEALALGVPVIVSKTTALNEFLNEPGCFGIEYPPDPVKLSQLILNIYFKHVKVGPFSNKIRTWDKVANNYEQIYEKCLFSGE